MPFSFGMAGAGSRGGLASMGSGPVSAGGVFKGCHVFYAYANVYVAKETNKNPLESTSSYRQVVSGSPVVSIDGNGFMIVKSGVTFLHIAFTMRTNNSDYEVAFIEKNGVGVGGNFRADTRGTITNVIGFGVTSGDAIRVSYRTTRSGGTVIEGDSTRDLSFLTVMGG